MKIIFFVYNAAIDDEVDECLARCKVQSFTKFPLLHGKGKLSDPHMGTHIWPATNSALWIACDDEKVQPIMEEVSKLKSSMTRVGIKVFVMPLEDMI
jgi:nitrogen regulatory protein PII